MRTRTLLPALPATALATGGLVLASATTGGCGHGHRLRRLPGRCEGQRCPGRGQQGLRTTHNGYETHTRQSGWGCGTVFRNNTSDLTGAKGDKQIAINVTNYGTNRPTTVHSSNTVTGGKGLTDIAVTP